MSRVLLDTSGYAALMRGHPQVQRVLQEAEEICLNPIILGELLAGFLRGNATQKNRKELASFFDSPRVTALEIDRETSERYAAILNSMWSMGTPIPTNDIWIAASAMQHGLRVLTTDRHFQKVPQILVDIFEVV